MSTKTKNGLMCSFRINQKDVEKFDRRIKRAGFTSRSDFFSALVRIVISEPKQNPKDAASAWILNQMPPLSEEKKKFSNHSKDRLTRIGKIRTLNLQTFGILPKVTA